MRVRRLTPSLQVIQYGYLTMFATAFPLAPLLVVIVIMIDVRTDIQRYLFRSRRPIARRCGSQRICFHAQKDFCISQMRAWFGNSSGVLR
jgi:hypothetical protein